MTGTLELRLRQRIDMLSDQRDRARRLLNDAATAATAELVRERDWHARRAAELHQEATYQRKRAAAYRSSLAEARASRDLWRYRYERDIRGGARA